MKFPIGRGRWFAVSFLFQAPFPRPRKMLHVRGLSLDGIMGVSPIRYGRDAIGLAMATEGHGARMFKNGARPGGVLKHPGKLSDEALEHLKLSWQASHGGENSGGTAILEEGMSYESVSMTNEDAQYLDTRQFQRTEICALFRVPPHMIGDLTKSSFSNIEQQALEFVKYSVLPWCKRIEAALWHGLLSEEQRQAGYRIEFLVDGLERADIKTRYESYSIAIQNGILSPNECRRLENRNPREGGDVFLQPLNMTDGTQGKGDEEEAKALPFLPPWLQARLEEEQSEGGKTPVILKREALKNLLTNTGMVAEASPASIPESDRRCFTSLREVQHDSSLAHSSLDEFSHSVEAAPAAGVKASIPPERRGACHVALNSAPRNDALERDACTCKAADEDEDDEPEHDDWADGEWNEESADLNQIMRDFRPKLEKMYRQIVAKEVAEIRKLVDRYFPEGKRVKSAEAEFMDALQLFYGQLKPELARTCQPLYADLSGIVVAMAAKQCGVDEQKLLKKLQSTVKDYASIEAADYVQSSLGQLQKLVDQKENVRAVLQNRITEWEEKRHVKVSKQAAVYGPNWYAREAYQRAGVKKIRWVANGSKTCRFCAKLHGKVVGIKDPFVGKDGTMPGKDGTEYAFKRAKKQPPIHRGCVCALVPVVDAVVPEKMKASVKKCAEAADLFAAGGAEANKKASEALTEFINATGLLKGNYEIKNVGFSPKNPNAYMAVSVGEGKIDLNHKSFEVDVVGLFGRINKHEWQPAQGVLNALKKIHEGRLLTFMDEAALAGLYHEIQHIRQNFSGGVTEAQKPLLEVVNEWTARRNYHKFLKKLGRESIITDDRMLNKMFGRYDWVKNFDALLNHLKIDGDKLLDNLTKINETEPVGLFDESISRLLGGMTRVKSVEHIKGYLQNISDPNFNGYLE